MTRPWRLNSIFGRIIVLHLLAVAVTSAVIVGAAYVLFDNIFLSFEHRTLHQHERTLAQGLRRTPGGWALDLPPGVQALYSQQVGGFHYAVVGPGDRVLLSSAPMSRPFLSPGSSPTLAAYIHPAGRGSTFAAASFPERREGELVWVQVAQNLVDPDQIADDVLAEALKALLWGVPIVVLLLAVADAFIIRRALRPVIAASQLAGEIHPHRIDLRLPTAQLPAEIHALAGAVNQALDRLEQGFRTQREFTADAAHELRTPLTVLRLRIDALCEPAVAATLKADVDVMARIVGQLLSIAELEATTIDLDRRVDLCALAADVVGFLAPIAVSQGKDLAYVGPPAPVWVRGDRDLLFDALRNLAENAIAHTAAGEGVEIDVCPTGHARVLDRGRGIDPADRELLFRRFWRQDRQASRGAGLGLAIVARIAAAHGGRVQALERPGGGAMFDLELRLAGALEAGEV